MPDYATDPPPPEKKPVRSYSALRPSKLIVEIGAAALCLLLVAVCGLLVVDQIRNWTSEHYRLAQVERRDFYCARHFDDSKDLPNNATDIQRAEYEVQKLLEDARMRALPTDSLGKLSTFLLCAKVSKVSLSTVEITETVGVGQVAALKTVENVEELRGRLKGVKAAVRRFPDTIYQEQDRILVALRVSVEKQVDPIQVAEIDPGDNNRWLIVAGADQSDEAALVEVNRLKALVAELPENLKAAALPPQIYLIGSWRRTAVPFDSQATARAALEALLPKLPYGGYLRAEAQWCADATAGTSVGPKIDSTVVIKCGP